MRSGGPHHPLRFIFSSLGFALCLVLLAASPPRLSDRLIERHVLPNGLRVILVPDRDAPAFAITAAYGYGPAFEGRGEAGGALILWDLLNQGGVDLPMGTLPGLVRQRGGQGESHIGPKALSFTTRYPSHELSFALWLESQRLRGLPEALPERLPDMAEESLRRAPLEMASLTSGTALFRRPSVGSSAEGYQSGGIRQLHSRYITPNNGVLTLVGVADTRRVMAQIQRYFGDIPRGAPLPPAGPGFPGKGPLTHPLEHAALEGAQVFAYRLGDLWNPDLPILRVAIRGLFDPAFGLLNQPEFLQRYGLRHLRAWVEPTSDGALLKGMFLQGEEGPGEGVDFFAALEGGEWSGVGSADGARPLGKVWSQDALAQALSLTTLASNHAADHTRGRSAPPAMEVAFEHLQPYLRAEGRSVSQFSSGEK